MELFAGFDPRQLPLFPHSPTHSTGVWPAVEAARAELAPSTPGVCKCEAPELDYCDFVGGLVPPAIWEAENS